MIYGNLLTLKLILVHQTQALLEPIVIELRLSKINKRKRLFHDRIIIEERVRDFKSL